MFDKNVAIGGIENGSLSSFDDFLQVGWRLVEWEL